MPEYEVGSLYALIGVDNKPALAGLAQTQAAMEKTAAKMDAVTAKSGASMAAVGKKMQSVGKSMSKWITLPVVAAGVASAKFAVDFQRDMEMVRTQAGASQLEVTKMSKAILAMAASGRVSQGPDELAKGLFHLESVGLRGAKALDALKVAAEGAAVGGNNLEDTASALAGVIITNIKGAQNYNHAMAIVNATVGAGNMRMADLVDALKSGIAPVAKTAGMSLQDLAAGLAMMTDEGVPAGTAANRLRTAIFMLTNPTKKAATELKSIGLTTTDLGHDLRKPDGLMVAMTDLQKHLSSIQDPTKKLAALGQMFGGSRSAGTIAMLLNNLGRLGIKYDQIGKTAGNFNKDVFQTQQTAAFKLKAAWAQLQAAMVRVGAVVLPVFTSIAQKVAGVATAFSQLGSTMQGTILVFAGVLAALGPIEFMLGTIARAYSGVAAAAKFAGRAMGLANAEAGAGGAAGAAAKTGSLYSSLPDTAFAGARGGGAAGASGVAAEETAMGGLSGAAVGLGPILLGVGAAVGLVGGAMYLASTSTDSLAGAFGRAKGAVTGLGGSLDHLKAAHLGVREATIQNTAAQLAVKQAQANVNAIVKAGGKGTLAYKEAVNQEAQAEMNAAGTTVQLGDAHKKLKAQQQATRRETSAAKDATDKLTDSVRKQLVNMKGLTSENSRGVAAAGHFGQVTSHNSSLLQNAAGKFDDLAAAQAHAADVAQSRNNPALAATMQKAAAANRATAELITTLGRLPTKKEINIQVITDFINRYGGGGGGSGAATGASPTGHPHSTPPKTGKPKASLASSLVGANIVANVVASAKAAAPKAQSEFERIIQQIMARMHAAIGKYGPRIVQEFKNLGAQIAAAFDAATAKMQAALDKQLNAQTAAGKELQALQAAHDEAARQQAIADARAQLAIAIAQGDPAAILAAQQALDDALYQEQVAQLEKEDAAEQAARAKKIHDDKVALAKRRAELKKHIDKVLKELNRAEQRAADIKKAKAELAKAEGEKAGAQRTADIKKAQADLKRAKGEDAGSPHDVKELLRLLRILLHGGGSSGGKGGGGGTGKPHPGRGGHPVAHYTFAKGSIVVQAHGLVHSQADVATYVQRALIASARRSGQTLGGLVS
jgi:TP901 family phage tail tape measure protein